MMAFFLVMWILGLDQPSKNMTADYFNDPTKFMREYRKDPAGFVKTYRGGNNPNGKGTQVEKQPRKTDLVVAASKKKFEQAQHELEAAIARDPNLKDLAQHVEIKITEEGLKIELMEDKKSVFFTSGSAQVQPKAAQLLAVVAKQLNALSNPIVIEGHTDITPYTGRTDYTNWELSADRANAARRLMEAAGLTPGQIRQVRGYAATKLRDPLHPTSFSNRRVSILVTYHQQA